MAKVTDYVLRKDGIWKQFDLLSIVVKANDTAVLKSHKSDDLLK